MARQVTRSLIGPQRTASALTPREREILLLVARAQSNNDIAHVGYILGKLGLASRRQATLWAVREELVAGP